MNSPGGGTGTKDEQREQIIGTKAAVDSKMTAVAEYFLRSVQLHIRGDGSN